MGSLLLTQGKWLNAPPNLGSLLDFDGLSPAWESKFETWRQRPGETELTKIERTERMIREAIKADAFLQSLDLSVIVQGSYANNTNVRSESDVDICVILRDTVNRVVLPAYQGASHYCAIPTATPKITAQQFKNALHVALYNKFGDASVSRHSGKCIEVHAGTGYSRVDADVVPAILHELYTPQAGHTVYPDSPRLTGVAIFPDQGNVIINWPLQHLTNGREKNKATGYKFKAAVRILKTLNLMMKSDYYTPIPSFLIESLVYNCPNSCFTGDNLCQIVQSVLSHLSVFGSLLGMGPAYEWTEVNGIKMLFGSHQKWQTEDAAKFITQAKRRLATTP